MSPLTRFWLRVFMLGVCLAAVLVAKWRLGQWVQEGSSAFPSPFEMTGEPRQEGGVQDGIPKEGEEISVELEGIGPMGPVAQPEVNSKSPGG